MKKNILKVYVMVVALMCGSYATAQVAVSADRATQIEWSRQYAQVGDLSNAFFASQTLWTDGFYVYKLFAAEGKVFLEPISMRLLPEKSPRSIEMVMKNGKLTVKNTKEVVAHETIGGWDLLVFRDKKQKTKNTFVRVKEQTDKFDDMMERDLHLIYDGLYELFSVDEGEAFYPNTLAPIGAKVLFGSNIYGDNLESNADPGNYTIDGGSIFFGDSRIKQVRMPSLNVEKKGGKDVYSIDGREVSQREFEQARQESLQRGRGGHASLPGPTQWDVSLREQGLTVVAHLHEGVGYSPFCGSYFTLTKVDDGYPELNGFYSFASVVPLTRGMLERFPKNALRLMQWEMYARHGLPILDPAYQNYFNGCPWYKPTGSRTLDMTDLEVINFRLIQTVEFEK